jgi:ABC-type Fe3+-hydroxamate transport system substrate-binding protein
MRQLSVKGLMLIVLAALVLLLPAACTKLSEKSDRQPQARQQAEQIVQLDQTRQKAQDFRVGPVQMAPHPESLEGKTVVLRWNGKLNGDKVLNRLAELLAEKATGVKVVRMWEEEPSTATTSYNPHNTDLFTERIAALKPDLVIASSADGDRCSAWLTIDQLNLEKRGIPTVTITTDVFKSVVESTMKTQRTSGMAVVALEHPIAGRNTEDTGRLVEKAFPEILDAATAGKPAN